MVIPYFSKKYNPFKLSDTTLSKIDSSTIRINNESVVDLRNQTNVSNFQYPKALFWPIEAMERHPRFRSNQQMLLKDESKEGFYSAHI